MANQFAGERDVQVTLPAFMPAQPLPGRMAPETLT